MSISRIYQDIPLKTDAEIELSAAASHHLARVLRVQLGDAISVFNGEGGEYAAVITAIDKKKVLVKLGEFVPRSAESSLKLYLAQGISRGEKMDYVIQKAVELGATGIVPLITERCNVKLDDERRQKRFQHWQAIVVSACEQSGRNTLPELLPPQTLAQWLPEATADFKWVLAPTAVQKLDQIKMANDASVILLIGPEGGLSPAEMNQSSQFGFMGLNLGPRVLRTETAALAALTILQGVFGDMVR
jgi:16S rRNA (uracil1498-N3)-methyltransferase